jgi:hypothetical protein
MFAIEANYKEIKGINSESSELRTVMLLYSKLVVHDIHLLSEVKKDVKLSRERTGLLSNF